MDYVPLEQIRQIVESIPVGAMGMGTGENILHPQFEEIVRYLHSAGVKLSIASNGHSIMTMAADVLAMFNDLEVSIDYPSAEQQDGLRGPGNWALVHRAIERAHAHGKNISILATLMSTNYDQMDEMVGLARSVGALLRVNVYQAVRSDYYRLTYEQFWHAYRRLFQAGQVVSCAEPIVRAAMGLPDIASPCGRNSIRFDMRGRIIPCVYWPMAGAEPLTIADLPAYGERVLEHTFFAQARGEATEAADCRCQGGCASRRAIEGNLAGHDEYCPWVRGDVIDLPWQAAPAVDLVRSKNVCTTIVM
jgi:MoaA/NifB/PqqE/SkfB family radical SAM enzyme